MFFFVDESGHTGANLFDAAQPKLYYGLLSSAVFVEAIFARPGIGKLIVDAASMRNFPVVQGGVLTTVFLFALTMPIADLLVAWLDPRVRATL